MSTGIAVQPKNVTDLRMQLMAMLPGAKSRYPDLPITSSDIVMLSKSAERVPELLTCSVASVMGALVEAKSMGWCVDGITGQAYLVPFAKRATLMPGYRGMMDLVRRSGQCEPSMDAIHKCDTWAWSGNTFDKPTFQAGSDPDRRSQPIIGAYAQGFFFNQGFTKTFFWPYAQIIAHRDRYSQAWARYKKPDNPWHPEHMGHWVMCAKTVLIDAIKRGLPISQQDMRIARRVMEQDAVNGETWTPGGMDDADVVQGKIAADLEAEPVSTVSSEEGPVDIVSLAKIRLGKARNPQGVDDVLRDLGATFGDQITQDIDATLQQMGDARKEQLSQGK